MKKINVLYLVMILFCAGINSSFGNTYVVTSNASGTTVDGVSLRWAITQANANPGSDSITFNIPGMAPKIITLSASLPAIMGLNANGTIIDGTTQPANGFGGMSPKIIINGHDSISQGLLVQANHCQVLGLCITRFTSNAITFSGANSFILGKPGRGNVINNVHISGTGVAITGVDSGKILSNKIGTDTTGFVAQSCYIGISTDANTRNIQIGGSGIAEGNIISGQMGANSENIYISGSKFITIKGNFIGPDRNGHKIPFTNTNVGIYLFAGADSCIIGGSLLGEGNTIAYNMDTTNHIGGGIECQSSANDLISRNKIFCNGNWGGIEMIAGNNNYPVPVISVAHTNGAMGTSSPNAIVELFYNHSGCYDTTIGCSGETFIGTVTASLTGNWSYIGALTLGTQITATATDSVNNTSGFASCVPVTSTVGIENLTAENPFNIFPNPFNSSTTLVVNNDLMNGGSILTLTDVLGRDVRSIKITERSTIIQKGDLSSGVYFYRLINNQNIIGSGKLVIQ